ncbi:uncharacterized protein LOC110175425 isoform X2 [Boleophthalmus pectinirostris]|uniref:uncharacterized protein LOC110175425 isoform X2 n=1 Tax=Boleophthalmus pectinirostris TaxID=150288 RepID=UPI00242F002D|nr:uncharacterized protein LOC110175425 isoform X2 [Boleophthalmus pectinirostris]
MSKAVDIFLHAVGAPSTAVYKFVKCNPEGDQANCITHQSANMEWSRDLPTKLPASATQYLEAEPVEDERDPEEEEDPVEEEEEFLGSEEGESPLVYLPEDGSGDGGSGFMADIDSKELLDKNYKPNRGGRKNRTWDWLDKRDEQKPSKEEMMEEHLLHQ